MLIVLIAYPPTSGYHFIIHFICPEVRVHRKVLFSPSTIVTAHIVSQQLQLQPDLIGFLPAKLNNS